MAEVFDRQRRMMSLGDAGELQEWRVERLVDDTFEYHAYVGHNYSKNGEKRLSKGAIWMLMKLADPAGVNEEMRYRMGRTGIEGGPDDTLTTEWANRATATYYRFDECLRQFFNG